MPTFPKPMKGEGAEADPLRLLRPAGVAMRGGIADADLIVPLRVREGELREPKSETPPPTGPIRGTAPVVLPPIIE